MLSEIAHADAPRIEFATREAVGRGVHPVRLTVDTAGPRRESPLQLEAPRGARFMHPPPANVAEGEDAVAVLFEGRADGFDRTAPAIINTLFVPDNPDPLSSSLCSRAARRSGCNPRTAA